MTLMGMGGAGAYGRDVRIVVTAVDNASGTIGAITKKYKTFGDQLTSVGRRLTLGITAPLLAIGIAAIKTASDYESAFIGVMKTTEGLGESIHDLTRAGEELWQGFVDLSQEIPNTAAELAGIGEIAGQLGVPKENILDFTNTIAELGMATNLTVNEAATSFARFANITRMPLDDIHKLGSSITELGNNTATTEHEIMEMAMRVAGVGAVVGLTQPQILGWAAAMSELGLRSQMGGTALSRAFVAMHQSISEGGEKLEGFAKVAGMTVDDFVRLFETDASGAMEAFIGGLADIDASGGNVLATLETLELSQIRVRDTILRLVGGYERLSSVMGWAEDGYEKDIALTREAERRKESLASQIKFLRNDLQELAITFANDVMPAIRTFIDDVLRPTIQGFSELDEATREGIVWWGLYAVALGPALTVLGNLLKVINFVKGAIIALGGVVSVAAATLGLTIAVYNKYYQEIKKTTQAQMENIDATAGTYEEYVKLSLELQRTKGSLNAAAGGLNVVRDAETAVRYGVIKSREEWERSKQPVAEYANELAGLDPTLMSVKRRMEETKREIKELQKVFSESPRVLNMLAEEMELTIDSFFDMEVKLEDMVDAIGNFSKKSTKIWADYTKTTRNLYFRHSLDLQKSEQQFQQKYAALLSLGLDKKAAKLKSSFDYERGMAEYNYDIQKQLQERAILEQQIIAQTGYIEDLKLRRAVFMEHNRLFDIASGIERAQAIYQKYELLGIQHGFGKDTLSIAEQIAIAELEYQRLIDDEKFREAKRLAEAIALLQKGQIGEAEDHLKDLREKLENFRVELPPLPALDLDQLIGSTKKATKSTKDMAEEIQETLLDAWESTGVQNALDELLTIVAQFNSDMAALVKEQEELYRYRYNFARKYIDLQTALEVSMNDTLIDMQFDYNLEARKQAIAYNKERLQLLRQGRTEEAKELLLSYAEQRSSAQYNYDVQLQLMYRANLKRQIERQEGYIVELQLQRDNFLIAFAQELSQNDAFLGLEATQQEALLSILSVGDNALLSEHLGYAIARQNITDALAEGDVAAAIATVTALLGINSTLVTDTETELERLKGIYEDWAIELPDLFTGYLEPLTTNLETAWTDLVMIMQNHYLAMEELRDSYQERDSEAWFNHHLQDAKEMALYYKQIELLTEQGRQGEIDKLTNAIHKKQAQRDWEIQVDLQLQQKKYLQDQVNQKKAYMAELIAQRHHFQMMYVEELMHSESFLALDSATQESLLNVFTGGQNVILEGSVEYAKTRLAISQALANGQIDIARDLMKDLLDIYSTPLADAEDNLEKLKDDLDKFKVKLPPIPDIMAGISAKAAGGAGKAAKEVTKTALEVLESVLKSLENAVKSARGIVGMLAEFMADDEQEVMRGFERFADFIVEAVERMYEAFERIDIPIEQLELLAQKAGLIGETFRDVAGITSYAEPSTTTTDRHDTTSYEFNLSGTDADLISQMLDALKLLEMGTESA